MAQEQVLWYYVDQEEEQNGPIDLELMRMLWQNKAINERTLVWREGQAEWKEMGDLPTLISEFQAQNELNPAESELHDLPEQKRLSVICPKDMDIPQTHTSIVGDWKCFTTADDVPYFFNTKTRELGWDKPLELQTQEERLMDCDEWVWITDPERLYLPVRVLKRKKGGAALDVEGIDGQRLTIERNRIVPLELNRNALQELPDDLVLLENVNDASITHCIRERYNDGKIYTWVGATSSVLISVNPFKQLPLYTPELMAYYSTEAPTTSTAPHVFAIASGSYFAMKETKGNQSILVSGESGAGKTEAAKQILSFFADVAGSKSSVEQKILHANPVLEAFGNAKTIRNNNSSRFGKWVKIHFNKDGLCGAVIENYLLEKSRVVNQQAGERNYHIFYQLCASNRSQAYDLESAVAYRFLNKGQCVSIESMDDGICFEETLTAIQLLGISSDETEWLLHQVAGILHLGNIDFESEGDSGSKIVNYDVATLTARHFDVSLENLQEALCCNILEIRNEKQKVLNSPKKAAESAEALGKALYSRMFDWLVQRINQSCRGAAENLFIGVLDIFGFEIFGQNSLEQLCINFTNEQLQRHFNAHTFMEEERAYENEDIEYDHVEFIDNQPILDLIEKKPFGLFHLLDEQARIPRGIDVQFMKKANQQYAQSPVFSSRGGGPETFVIRHYAGDVPYNCTGFVEKNKDSLLRGIYDLMAKSNHTITCEIFPSKDQNPRRIHTLVGQFRTQVSDLMKVLDSTEPRYIRCIKPNSTKQPDALRSEMCLEQLRYAGVFESVEIRRKGYPFRLSHKYFVHRYQCILGSGKQSRRDFAEASREIIESSGLKEEGIQIGITMVFYRATHHRLLELLRNLSIERVAKQCQRIGRGAIARRYVKQLRTADAYACASLRSKSKTLIGLETALNEVARVLGAFQAIFDYETKAITELKRLRTLTKSIQDVTEKLKELVEQDPNAVYEELVGTIEQAKELDGYPVTTEQKEVLKVASCKAENCTAAQIQPAAQEALDMLNREQMMDVVKHAKEVQYSSNLVEEVEKLLELPEEAFVKMQLQRAVEQKDETRVINRQIKLKEIYLKAHSWMFVLENYTGLRSSQEFAHSKYFGLSMRKEELADGFLKYSTKPIHTSLTKLPPLLVKEAIRCFKSILGYLGIRRYLYPLTLVEELMHKGLTIPELRVEIMIQMFKQLQNAPSSDIQSKVWDLLAVTVSTFPPPDKFENYFVTFIRSKHPQGGSTFISAMHKLQYGTPRTEAPKSPEIHEILRKFHRITKRTRFSIARVGDQGTLQAPVYTFIEEKKPQDNQETTTTVEVVKANERRDPANPPPPPEEPEAPPLPPRPHAMKTIAKVLYPFSMPDESMLDVEQDDQVEILESSDVDWWLVKSCGSNNEGWVPSTYLERSE